MGHHQRAAGKSGRIAGIKETVLRCTGRSIHALKGIRPRAQHRCILLLTGAVGQLQRLLHAQAAVFRIELCSNGDFIQPFRRFQQFGRGADFHRLTNGQTHNHSNRQAQRKECYNTFFHQISEPTLANSTMIRCTTPPIISPPATPHSASVTATESAVQISLPRIRI